MLFGKVLINFGVVSGSILVIGASLFASKKAEAQSIPACRNIQPRLNQVCFTEHPFSARQRDEGGTKDWSFIVERVAPNYVIVDYQLLIDTEFGAASRPTGTIVSAKGNASIIQESTRQEEKLGETKSQLKGKIQGCYPPVCGELQGQIDRIDREIQRFSDIRRTAVSAGGNEKILFQHRTSVSCSKFLGVETCKGGAAMNGKVRVNQRYLGDPNSLSQESLSLVEQSRLVLEQASKPIPGGSAGGSSSTGIDLIQLIESSYSEVFGREPTQDETKYWIGRSKQETVNFDILIANHRGWLRGGGDIDETIVRSYQAILSRSPNADEVNYWRQRVRTENLIYTDLIRNHQDWKAKGGT